MKTKLNVLLLAAILLGGTSRAADPAEAAAVLGILSKVADWQMANHQPRRPNEWTEAALYTGMGRFAKVSPDTRAEQWLLQIARGMEFKLERKGYHRFHADDHCVGQLYLNLFKDFREPAMLAPTREAMDDVLANQPDISTQWEQKGTTNRWNWCDSLFMAPPTLTRLYSVTGEEKYLAWTLREYQKTTAYLLDKENNLYFRDGSYLPEKRLEKNGKHILWARGNGWVFAGLANLLPDLPMDHPSRPYYEGIFKRMAASLIKLQQPDGAWHASLLDPDNYPVPETSGTAFFVYGLAWGVNHGLLDKAATLPVIEKGWARLVAAVHPDGKLGYVQPVGADPQTVTADMTETYGVGGFLLAGCEIWRIRVEALADHRAEKSIANPAAGLRNMAVSLALKDTGLAAGDPVLVLDADACAIVPAQTAHGLVTFVAPLGAKQTKKFLLLQGAALAAIKGGVAGAYPCFARHVPERMDDFAWENDRTAHRVYGPALQHTKGEHFSNGVDVWSKRVRTPVINTWYQSGQYHEDHGQGMDQYGVDATCGCGGTAILVDGKLVPGNDWVTHKLIESGPARVVFELTYAPFPVKSARITETKRFTLDRGDNFTRVESQFKISGAKMATLAIGVLLHPGMQAETMLGKNAVAAWETAPNPADGFIGTAAILTGRPCRTGKIPAKDCRGRDCAHLAILTDIHDGDTVSYKLGATWSAMRDFDSAARWFAETSQAGNQRQQHIP